MVFLDLGNTTRLKSSKNQESIHTASHPLMLGKIPPTESGNSKRGYNVMLQWIITLISPLGPFHFCKKSFSLLWKFSYDTQNFRA